MKKSTRDYVNRLLKSETGRIDKAYGDISVLLLYPNTYHVGMSNLGFQTIYSLINQAPGVRCERGFVFPDGEVFGMESGRTMNSFDIVAFSVSFELDYENVVSMLRAGNLPIYSRERERSYPLVIAGGVITMINPEPLADFVDLFIVGEGDIIVPEFIDLFRSVAGADRDKQLEELMKLRGVYVPRFYEAEYDNSSILTGFSAKSCVKWPVKLQKPDLDCAPCHTVILGPHTEFKNMFLIEINRGCFRGCRFCAAGSCYETYRYVSGEAIVDLAKKGMALTSRIGLVGSVVSDHPQIDYICDELLGMGAKISVSSFRADSASEVLIQSLGSSGVRTITIAPETGSERSRTLIGKKMTDDSIMHVAQIAKRCGIKFVKLYFLIGLPGETEEDLEAICKLTGRISRILPVKVSINPFIPKPGTPLERAPMNSRKELQAKVRKLRRQLSLECSVRMPPISIKEALLESFLSRSGREVSKYLAGETVPPRLIEQRACRAIPDDEIVPWDFSGE